MVSRRLWAMAVSLALPAVAVAQDLRVDLELTPAGAVTLDELAVLTIRVDGPTDRRVRPEADFELDNLRVVSGPSTSNRLLFHDGAASRSVTLTWNLKPLALGPARVYSARVRFGGREIPLPGARLEVREPLPALFNPREVLRDDPRDGSPANSSPGSPFEPPRRRRSRPVAPPEIYLKAMVEPADPYVGEQVLYTPLLVHPGRRPRGQS